MIGVRKRMGIMKEYTLNKIKILKISGETKWRTSPGCEGNEEVKLV